MGLLVNGPLVLQMAVYGRDEYYAIKADIGDGSVRPNNGSEPVSCYAVWQEEWRSMIEGLSDVMTPRAAASESESDRTVESVALAGAAAIQRLIADRDSLRERVNIQQRELVSLSSLNEDLRRRINLVRHHYVELGTKVLAQLEQFDQAFRDAMQDKPETAAASGDHANLIALANRLKPNRG